MRDVTKLLPSRQEDHNFFVRLRSREGVVVRGILCKLWLPSRIELPITMVLYPSSRQSHALERLRPPFSVKGRVVETKVSVTEVWADEVWSPFSSTRSLSDKRRETVMPLEPIDLHVVQRITLGPRTRHSEVTTNYWLTPFRPFAPQDLRSFSHTGEVTVDGGEHFRFTLRSGVQLDFTNLYRMEKREDGHLTYPQLVATCSAQRPSAKAFRVDDGALAELDDFLALAGFACRYRCACLQISSSTKVGTRSVFYRKNMSVPPKLEWDFTNVVIDLQDFEEFMRIAYAQFVASGPNELLRHAVHLLLPTEDRFLSSSFIALYAALETIVLWFRRAHGLEFIIEKDDDWQTLQRDTRSFLRTHPQLSGSDPAQKKKRGMITGKVGELRRVPFRTALHDLCTTYAVDLHDLWPVFDDDPAEVSLTEIRNRLVHGQAENQTEFHALMGAHWHMRWTVERVLLAVLRWPLERSKIAPDTLARVREAATELAVDRQRMMKVSREQMEGDHR